MTLRAPLRTVFHLGYVIRDMQAATGAMRERFGIENWHVLPLPEGSPAKAIGFAYVKDTMIELVEVDPAAELLPIHQGWVPAEASGARLNHVAFKVRDIHEVIGGGQYIDSKGWRTFAGPGRHMVSSACFWYFDTPLGCAWEYAADEDVVTEDWETTDFAARSHIFSEWTFGLAKSDGTLRGPISQSKSGASVE